MTVYRIKKTFKNDDFPTYYWKGGFVVWSENSWSRFLSKHDAERGLRLLHKDDSFDLEIEQC